MTSGSTSFMSIDGMGLTYTEVERVQKYCTQVKVPLHY